MLRELRERFEQYSRQFEFYSHSLFEGSVEMHRSMGPVIRGEVPDFAPFKLYHGLPAGPTHLIEGNVGTDLFGWYMHRRDRGHAVIKSSEAAGVRAESKARNLPVLRDAFCELAREAWRCVARMPLEGRGLFPGVAEDPRVERFVDGYRGVSEKGFPVDPRGVLEAHLWLLTLHRIGWRTARLHQASVLAIRPELWEWRDGRFVRPEDDAERKEGAMWRWVETNQIFSGRDRANQDLIVSDLPFSIFHSSVCGIDTILESGGGGRAVKSSKRIKKGLPQEETNKIVDDYLNEHPMASIRQLCRVCKVAQSSAQKSPAWQKLHPKERDSNQRSVKAGRLTNENLSAIGKQDDPAAPLMRREELERRYLADPEIEPEEKARYSGVPLADQNLLLDGYESLLRERAWQTGEEGSDP
jgi:hypothetical protein